MRIGAGRDGNLREDILGAGANQAHTFGAAEFYAAQQWSHAVHRGAGAGCMGLNSLATPPKTHAHDFAAASGEAARAKNAVVCISDALRISMSES